MSEKGNKLLFFFVIRRGKVALPKTKRKQGLLGDGENLKQYYDKRLTERHLNIAQNQ